MTDLCVYLLPPTHIGRCREERINMLMPTDVLKWWIICNTARDRTRHFQFKLKSTCINTKLSTNITLEQ